MVKILKKVFQNIPHKPLREDPRFTRYASQFLRDVKELQIGEGSKVFRGDKQGIWLGAKKWVNAPFRVDMEGNLTATSATISGYILVGWAAADVNANPTTISGVKITDGTVTASKLNVNQLSAITADIGTVTAGSMSGVTLSIGSGNSIFKADSKGIYLGNASFGSAPFRVNMSGNLTAKSVTIQDSVGTTLIDATGIISTENKNFAVGEISNSSSQTTTSTSMQDVNSMSLSFSLTRAARVLFMATITGGNNSDSGNGVAVEINLDGSKIGGDIYIPGHEYGGGILYETGSAQVIKQVGSGSHTVKLRFRAVNGGTARISANTKFLGYVVLGK